MMETRNARQCRERWQHDLNPDLSHEDWTPEDERLLKEKIQEYGVKWYAITSFFPNRSPIFLRNCWQRLKRQMAKAEASNPEDNFAPPDDTVQSTEASDVIEEQPPPAASPFNVFDFFETHAHVVDDRTFDPWGGFQG
jgi:hypothetical protein